MKKKNYKSDDLSKNTEVKIEKLKKNKLQKMIYQNLKTSRKKEKKTCCKKIRKNTTEK